MSTCAPIDWQRTDTVLLDMDGTLLDLRFDNLFWKQHLPRRLAELKNLPAGEAEQAVFPRMARLQGRIEWYCLDYWSRELEVDMLALKREIAHLIGWRPHARAFLEALGRADKRRVLVTNAHPDVLRLKVAQTGLDAHLDAIISAHDLQRPKEEQDFWHRLQQHAPFRPERSVLIDDNLAALASAQSYGVGTVLGIRRPDSSANPVAAPDVTLLECFSDVLPTAQVTG
ncbi:putative hydrolase of the HAD superfamily [Alkalispirillum mobile]|uniref:Putative hydrolase of the HAD superfamily n=1 Tax=Alkalispirillum mobile TaxID=85925 RepID=A0A498CGB6_9GAMM|nr:GMP/IMP nucleotidase [Alkalispirillum mobile]RLK51378.1 putative hydrolase of the HAD superfamily [Alkalispirillum mobile]